MGQTGLSQRSHKTLGECLWANPIFVSLGAAVIVEGRHSKGFQFVIRCALNVFKNAVELLQRLAIRIGQRGLKLAAPLRVRCGFTSKISRCINNSYQGNDYSRNRDTRRNGLDGRSDRCGASTQRHDAEQPTQSSVKAAMQEVQTHCIARIHKRFMFRSIGVLAHLGFSPVVAVVAHAAQAGRCFCARAWARAGVVDSQSWAVPLLKVLLGFTQPKHSTGTARLFSTHFKYSV